MKIEKYKEVIIGAIIPIIITAGIDYIKEKPILSTLLYCLKWIKNNIFEFELKVWHILTVVVVIILASRIFKEIFKDKNDNIDLSHWSNYMEDYIHGLKWRWVYNRNPLSGSMEIRNLNPACNKCETSMQIVEGLGSNYAECPRCNNQVNQIEDLSKVEFVIIDNIKRDLYLDKLKVENG